MGRYMVGKEENVLVTGINFAPFLNVFIAIFILVVYRFPNKPLYLCICITSL